MVRPEATDFLRAGIKASSARQSVIANNIANLNTPSFRRQAVNFEALMNEALQSGDHADPAGVAPMVIRPQNTLVDANGNDVNLDSEVGDLIKNSAMYKTYFRLLGKMVKQMEMAIGS